jgi:DNA-binding transcriptional ArsR family regulator
MIPTKKQRQVRSLAQMFRAMGDPTRLQILVLLGKDQSNVTSLCQRLQMRQPTVSHHLGVLRAAQLVEARRRGKEIFYSLEVADKDGFPRALKTILSQASKICFGKDVL